jgi:hypothetical protein
MTRLALATQTGIVLHNVGVVLVTGGGRIVVEIPLECRPVLDNRSQHVIVCLGEER